MIPQWEHKSTEALERDMEEREKQAEREPAAKHKEQAEKMDGEKKGVREGNGQTSSSASVALKRSGEGNDESTRSSGIGITSGIRGQVPSSVARSQNSLTLIFSLVRLRAMSNIYHTVTVLLLNLPMMIIPPSPPTHLSRIQTIQP